MKTVLVTGGAGFIGSNFITYLLGKYSDYLVLNLDRLTYAGNLNNLKDIQNSEKYMFLRGDICDTQIVELVFNKYDIDYIVNFAAESHVDRSIADPDIFIKTNVLGTLNLLNIAKQQWETSNGFIDGKKFVQISTDEVYGSLGEEGYFCEGTPLDPHSPYAASKASADMIVKSYFDTYKMPINITRCSNNYGPYQFPEKLIPLIINNALQKKPLPVYGDGMNIRDWLFVEDHCTAIDLVLHHGKLGGIYNIGGNNEKPNIEVIQEILKYLNQNVDSDITQSLIKYIKDRKGHDRRYAIDASRIRDELGWNPKTVFEDGITKTIKWYLENREWVTDVTTGEYQKFYELLYGKEVI